MEKGTPVLYFLDKSKKDLDGFFIEKPKPGWVKIRLLDGSFRTVREQNVIQKEDS